MKTTVKALALVLISLPLLASAGTKIATGTMQVSFVVKESCSVQSADKGTQRPDVACQLNTPYQLTRGADKAAAASSDTGAAIRTETAAQDWTVYF